MQRKVHAYNLFQQRLSRPLVRLEIAVRAGERKHQAEEQVLVKVPRKEAGREKPELITLI